MSAPPPEPHTFIRPDLSRFDNRWYYPGRNRLWQTAWFFLGQPILRCSILHSSAVRRRLLRLFGARIGRGVVIKPGVRVKYPWRLVVGNHSWIGEDCWIDNLDNVFIGDNTCLSQGVYLCTGNHDWSDPAFSLRIAPIRVGDGVWVAAKSCVGPGVLICDYSIVGFGAVVCSNVDRYQVVKAIPPQQAGWRTVRAQVSPASAETQIRP